MALTRLLSLRPEHSRARRYLLAHERLVAVVRRHPVWLARQGAIASAVVLVAGWVVLTADVHSLAMQAAGVAVLAALAYLGWHVLGWSHDRLVITDRRLILVSGIVTRRVAVMPLRKVTDMTYERPLLGRLLGEWGWGTFVMESAGQDQSLHRIRCLPRPKELYACVSEEIFGEHGLYGQRRLADPGEELTTTARRARRATEDTQEIPAVRDSGGPPAG